VTQKVVSIHGMGKHFSTMACTGNSENKQLHRLKNSVKKGITIHTLLFTYLPINEIRKEHLLLYSRLKINSWRHATINAHRPTTI